MKMGYYMRKSGEYNSTRNKWKKNSWKINYNGKEIFFNSDKSYNGVIEEELIEIFGKENIQYYRRYTSEWEKL